MDTAIDETKGRSARMYYRHSGLNKSTGGKYVEFNKKSISPCLSVLVISLLANLFFVSIAFAYDIAEIEDLLSKPSNSIQDRSEQYSDVEYGQHDSLLASLPFSNNLAKLLPTTNVTSAYAYRGVVIVDNYAYVTSRDGGYLLVYKLDSIRKAPAYLGNVYQISFLPINGSATTIARKGNYLYVGGDRGISVINITNRQSPQLVRTLNHPAYRSLKVIGNYLIASDYQSAIFDVLNPSAPLYLNTFGDHTDATIYKTTLYAGEWLTSQGVRIYDVSDIYNIKELAFIPFTGDVLHVEVMNNRLFALASQDNTSTSFLYSFSLAKPVNPVILDILQLNDFGRAFGITTSFCVVGSFSASVVDITDPKAMNVIGTVNGLSGTVDGFPYDVSISGNLLLLAGQRYVLAARGKYTYPVDGIRYSSCPVDSGSVYNAANAATWYTMVWGGRYSGSAQTRCEGSGGHPGVDIIPRTATSKNIKAIGDAKVIERNFLSGYGNYIILEHTNDPKYGTFYSIYLHLSSIDSSVQEGKNVVGGQQIGIMGNTGGNWGVHLHFQIDKTWHPVKDKNGNTLYYKPYWTKYKSDTGTLRNYPAGDDSALSATELSDAFLRVQQNTINPIELIREW